MEVESLPSNSTAYSSNAELEQPPESPAKQPSSSLRQPPLLLLVLFCLLTALAGCDELLLPCSLDALRLDLSLTNHELAAMVSLQAFCGTVAGPLWVLLAEKRLLSRRSILAVGSVGQGVITMLLAVVSSWAPMLLLRSLNGIMLAALRPVLMGVVAELTSEERRGRVFGLVHLSSQLGQMAASLSATPLSKLPLLGFSGWRVVFFTVGLWGLLVGLAVVTTLQLPPLAHSSRSQGCSPKQELKELRALFSPTFMVLLLQGLFGSMAIGAGTFSTMYYQMSGLSGVEAGLIGSLGQGACAVGIFIGGHVGDFASKVSKAHGRIAIAELSLAMGVPLMFLRFWGLPGVEGNFWCYAGLTVLHGMLALWAPAGSKMPLLSEVVAPERTSAVMAWDATLEGSLSAALGVPMTALLAEALFDYSMEDLKGVNARALGKATAVMTSVPTLLSLCCWPLLHFTYPRDLARRAAKGP